MFSNAHQNPNEFSQHENFVIDRNGNRYGGHGGGHYNGHHGYNANGGMPHGGEYRFTGPGRQSGPAGQGVYSGKPGGYRNSREQKGLDRLERAFGGYGDGYGWEA